MVRFFAVADDISVHLQFVHRIFAHISEPWIIFIGNVCNWIPNNCIRYMRNGIGSICFGFSLCLSKLAFATEFASYPSPPPANWLPTEYYTLFVKKKKCH